MKGLRVLELLVAVVLVTTTAASAGSCDASAISVVSGYLEARDGGDYRRAQRYLSPDFGQHFREQTGAAYLEYVAASGRNWRESRLEATTATVGQCVAQVATMRETDAGATSAVETYTLLPTPRGWRIDRWEWQPAE